MTPRPSISVVIPTRGRPHLLARAVASAIGQTLQPIEIIVVVDGPDPATQATLATVADPRLRVIVNDASVGGGEARNIGVRAAIGEWIAFLDDDDEWLPAKLASQAEAITTCGVDEPIAFCAVFVRDSHGLHAWRSRAPGPDEPVSEYLFVRRSLRVGEGTVGTSTIVARRSLLTAIPFDAALPRFQDADWVLRAAAAGARLVYCPDRLAIWDAPGDGPSITAAHATDWTYAYDWIRARRHLVTGRAYAAFLLVRAAALARASGDRTAQSRLWAEARRAGSPGIMDMVLWLGRWVVPDRVRLGLRRRLARVVDPTVDA